MISDDENFPEDVLQMEMTGEDTAPEDRSQILAMACRLRRILEWNLGDFDVLFERNRGPEIVRDILDHFLRWKTFACDSDPNPINSIGTQHLVIYSMAKLCFFYWVQDSEMVAEVLGHVYSCDGHFSSMLTHIINAPLRNAMWPLMAAPEVREKQHLTLLFFLSHAHRMKLLFDGSRFVDVRLRVPIRVPPAFVAAIYNKPKLLLLLLRYGASLDCGPVTGLTDDWDLYMLLRHLLRILWSSLGPDLAAWGTAVVSSTVGDVWQCLRILLRVVKQVPKEELNFSLMNFNSAGITLSRNSHDLIRTLSDEGILPQLAPRYLEPPELQHLCRCTIREALNRNWKLPFGIHTLPLPKPVQAYLDLLKD